jgi:hypothetical protein
MRTLLLLIACVICLCGTAALAAPDANGCAAGYELAGVSCTLTIPAHAIPGAGGSWTCERGTYDADGRCVPVDVPEHARLSAAGHTWVCDAGYHDAGTACLPGPEPTEVSAPCGLAPLNRDGSCGRVPVPRHARRIAMTGFWLCQSGYQRIGDTCAPVRIPRFAHPSVTRDDWLCNRGYQRNYNLCVEIDVPDHATLGYYGDAWFCDRGYYEIRGVCLPETDEHRAITARYGGGRERLAPAATVMHQAAPRPAGGDERPSQVGMIGQLFVGAYLFAGALAILVATFTLFNNWRPPSQPSRHLTMAYVPRRRGSGAALAIWRPFGHRVDALTGAPIEPAARIAQCRNCHAWYGAASVAALRHENEARCIACGRAAVSYTIG